MVKMTATYRGELHCEIIHGPSGSKVETDAPKDNMGRGENFSPTDLVGSALLTCVMTTIAIVAERDKVSIEGMRGEVTKEMVADPKRRIGALPLTIHLPASIPEDYRKKIEHVAHACPVHKSLHPDVQMPMTFVYS